MLPPDYNTFSLAHFVVARWCVAAPLLLLSLLTAVCNNVIAFQVIVRKRSTSLIPFVGGIAGAAALLLLPVPGAPRYFWIPLVVDFGTLPALVWLVVWRISGRPR